MAGNLKSTIKNAIDVGKKYWNSPYEGNYVPYKEVATIGVAGFGVHWTSVLASTIALNAGNFIVGACIGLQPLHLQIMLIVANLIGIPIGVLRGWAFDNCHFKGGKFLPIMMRTPIPIVAISTLMVWLPYDKWAYITKAVVVWIIYFILQIFLSFYNEAWAYFQQVVTPNAQERVTVMSIYQIIYSLAPTITSLVIPTIAGLTFGMNNIWTYRIIYPGFTIIGLILLMIFLPKLKERIILPKKTIQYVSTIDSLREVAKNKYFWIINVALWIGFLEGSCMVILQWSFVYGNGGANQHLMGVANTIIGNAALWAMLLTPFMIKKIGKRNLLILHNSLNIVLFVILLFVYNNIFMVCVIFYLNAFINTFANIYNPNIQADMRDYHQWKTGVRVDGMFGAMGVIGTVIGFFTGLVLPSIYEHMGIKQDYNVLYDDTIRNNLFRVLIICSIIGATLNLIPYLFYDLTEQKHRGYVNVLKVRTMFEDYENKALDEGELVEAMTIIDHARSAEFMQKIVIDKSKLKLARKMPKKTDEQKAKRKQAIKEARKEINAAKKHNEIVESLPIVVDELDKFNTLRYKEKLNSANEILNNGEIYYYKDWKDELKRAKALPKKTQEEKDIREDAIKLAREKKASAKLIEKYGTDNLVRPNDEVRNEIANRDIQTIKENIQAKKELKKYTKGVSVFNRISYPYYNAKKLIDQAENYTHLGEIEEMYNKVVANNEQKVNA